MNGERRYLWRAVDHDGEVLESFVTAERDKAAALKFLKKALKRHGPVRVVFTDRLRLCRAAMKQLGNQDKQDVGRVEIARGLRIAQGWATCVKLETSSRSTVSASGESREHNFFA